MSDYTKLPPNVQVQPKPFKAHVEDKKLQQLKELVKLSPIGPETYENTSCGRQYGMTREYLIEAKQRWETSFDWRKWEDRINSFPNYTMDVENKGVTINIHFIALFSERADAVPLAFYHGWPGSILEFLDMLNLIKSKYSPQDLPYHVIVPSLPGYGYSSGPPTDREYLTEQAAAHLDKLMQNLGFASGYIAQGGDIGSTISRLQATHHDSCKGMHINMIGMAPPENAAELHIDELEKKAMERSENWRSTGMAYFMEHRTRTSTIGLALSANPVAMLSWIGEKFLEWTDKDPSIDEILASVSLYWLTDCYARCIYPYRAERREQPFVEKPSGYSLFLYDIVTTPKSWMEYQCNLISYAQHENGGHFAAMEKPDVLLADVEEYVKKAWKGSRL